MRVGGLVLGMGFEDIVHHRQAEATHELAVELELVICHAVTQTMKVILQIARLFFCKSYDGVLVECDAAPDAVVVRWQQVLQELVVGCKPFHL